jgi:hypothetical protein
MEEVKWSIYSKTLPMAREIYEAIYPEHTTHVQWAESFNKIGKINRIIIKNL